MSHRPDASRDLLFGLLALQTGLIDQGALFSAFHAWTSEKGPSMGEILERQGAINPSRRAILDGLVEEHAGSVGGTDEDRPRPETRATGIGSTEDETADEDPCPTASFDGVGTLPEGSRFRILRHHARGGLGAVFVALDTELNREVALKQILERHADNPASRTRFLLEAEVTGGLEHPGIVPVYGLGHDLEGRPYYAMRFIRGDTLKDAIARFHGDKVLKGDPGARSLALRQLLRRFLDACNAIDYAHGRGVLHRDIKPSNVMVGKHGETLVVDWGLAKAVGRKDDTPTDERTLVPNSSSGSAETLPGSAIGTPAYMSPEQARGDLDRVGVASDVYSLGATLYSLIAGRPPFEGPVEKVLKAVKEGDFPAPREVDREIHPSLEAVCLKAMALNPVDHYESARALADDVERWMADEPVMARPESFGERFGRRLRRHRTAAMVAAASLIVASIGLGSTLAVQAVANEKRALVIRDLKASLGREESANRTLLARSSDLEQANRKLIEMRRLEADLFDKAMKTIKNYLLVVGRDPVIEQPQSKNLKQKLFKTSEIAYEWIASNLVGAKDPESRRRLAKIRYDQGEANSMNGNAAKSLDFHLAGLAIRRDLLEASKGDLELRYEVTRSLSAIGLLKEKTGKPVEALANYQDASANLEELTRIDPKNLQYQYRLADGLESLGRLHDAVGRVPEALQFQRRALEIRETLPKDDPSMPTVRSDLVRSYDWLGFLLAKTGPPAECLAYYEKARAIREKMARDNPDNIQILDDLGKNFNNIAFVLKNLDRVEEAKKVEELRIRTMVKIHPHLIEPLPARSVETLPASSLAAPTSVNNLLNLIGD